LATRLELIPQSVQKAVATIVYVSVALFALVLLGVLAWTVLSMSGIGFVKNPLTANQAIVFLGVSIATIAAVLWSANLVGVISLPQKVSQRIWVTLISGLLAAVVAQLSKAFG
jgi:hypothetical protein